MLTGQRPAPLFSALSEVMQAAAGLPLDSGAEWIVLTLFPR